MECSRASPPIESMVSPSHSPHHRLNRAPPIGTDLTDGPVTGPVQNSRALALPRPGLNCIFSLVLDAGVLGSRGVDHHRPAGHSPDDAGFSSCPGSGLVAAASPPETFFYALPQWVLMLGARRLLGVKPSCHWIQQSHGIARRRARQARLEPSSPRLQCKAGLAQAIHLLGGLTAWPTMLP